MINEIEKTSINILNDKLAEWADFEKKGNVYIWPDGKFDFSPTFTEDVKAIEKWLIPKLHNCKGRFLEEIHLYPHHRDKQWLCELDMSQMESKFSPECCKVEHNWGENIALAICKAIENYIDSEEI